MRPLSAASQPGGKTVRRPGAVRAFLLQALAVAAVFLPLTFVPAASADTSGVITFTRNKLVENKGEGRKFKEVQSLWKVNGDGTGVRRLRARISGAPGWIAGGRRLATFWESRARHRVGFQIFSRRFGGDRQRLVIDLPHSPLTGGGVVGGLAWAPDGKQLAFDYYSKDADTTSIWLRPLDGLERQLPLGAVTYLANPSWSPDGGLIAAVGSFGAVPSRPIDTSVGVFLLDPAGGDPGLLASWPQVNDTGPNGASWSPDGRTLAVPYQIENPGGTRWDDYAQLLLIDVRSGGVRELFRDREPATRYSVPAWSPDGRKLAYTRSQGVNRVKIDIWIGDPATGQTRNLTRTPKPVGDFSWSPDGRRIALSCGQYVCGKPKGIWTLSLNRKWKRLTRGFDFGPTWTPR